MPAPIDWERWHRWKRAIETALRDGYHPPGQTGGRGSAVEEARRRLEAQGHKINRGHFTTWRQTQAKRAARGADHALPDWSLYAPAGLAPAEAATGKIRRWILTAAQDDTDTHPAFWANLQSYARHLSADLVVAGMTYQQIRHTDRLTLTNTYRPELRDHLRFEPLDCGPVLFAADLNILPTAARPLSGLDTYGRGRDTVFPHTKLAYQTVPQMPGSQAPVILTTGCVTVPNYIEKKAGKKAEFHHVLGATIVELTPAGEAFCRPIQATSDGAFYDLDRRVAEGKVTTGHRLEAVTWGDIHNPTVPAAVFDGLWGRRVDSLIDELRPRHQIMHDLLSLDAFSRYEINNPLHWVAMAARGLTGIEHQVASAAGFLRETARDHTVTVVVESNHDKRLEQWTQRPTDRRDAENVRYWHECNLALLRSIERAEEGFNLLRYMLRRADASLMDAVAFVPEGGSYVVCPEIGGIEVGAHGHLGPNGSRGSLASMAKMGRRGTIAHVHAPGILDGMYAAGMTGDLDQGYNKGPSSWRRAHVLHYADGKRTIVTQTDQGRWRA